MCISKSSLSLFLFFFILFTMHAEANTRIVGTCETGTTQHATISQAIAAAVSGDTIKICKGTYPENITLLKSNLTFTSGSDVVTPADVNWTTLGGHLNSLTPHVVTGIVIENISFKTNSGRGINNNASQLEVRNVCFIVTANGSEAQSNVVQTWNGNFWSENTPHASPYSSMVNITDNSPLLSCGGGASVAPELIAEYRLDECNLGSTAIDSSTDGINNDGAVIGLVQESIDGQLCGSGEFSGGAIDIDNLDVNTSAGAKTTVTFWMKWDGTDNVMPFGWQIHDLWLMGGMFGFNTGSSDIYGISDSSSLANRWVHVVAVFTNGSVDTNKLYIDGIKQNLSQVRNIPSLSRAVVSSSARIGGWRHDNGYRFRSHIDEVKIFRGEMSSAAVQTMYDNEREGKNQDGSERVCTLCPDTSCQNGYINQLHHSTYNVNGYAHGHIDSHAEFNDIIASHANNTNRFGLGTIADINTQGNNNNPFGAGSNYLTIIKGFVYAPEDGNYTFVVNGDDAVEVLIDDVVVSHWYGEHARSSDPVNDTSITKHTVNLTVGYYKIEFRHHELTGEDNYELYWKKPSQTNFEIIPASNLFRCSPPLLIAEYRFEEDLWSGIADEIRDSSINQDHGIARFGATTDSNGSICRGGVFDRSSIDINNLNVSTAAGAKTTVTFWMKWDGTDNVMPFGWQIHDLWLVDGMFGFNTGNGDVYGIPNSSSLANRWVHVVAVFTNGSVNTNKLYIDGIEQNLSQVRNIPSLSRAVVSSSARIGGWRINDGYRFRGHIDEVKIFRGEMSSADVLGMYNNERLGKNWWNGEVRQCEVGLYGFDAWDTFRDINDRNISTKIASRDFNLTIASLDQNRTNFQEFNGTVCATVEDNTRRLFFEDENISIAEFNIARALRDIRVNIKWKRDVNESCPLVGEDNSSVSSDNFAIRPEKLVIAPIAQLRAGMEFDFNVSANALDYNVSSLQVDVNISDVTKTCFSPRADFNLSTIIFLDGESNNSARFGDVGVVDINIIDETWAEVDNDDTPGTCDENGTFICSEEKNVTIIPHHFEVNASLSNFGGNNFTYFSRDLNMSAILDINITAQNRQNQRTQNYSHTCYAKAIDINITTNSISDLPDLIYIFRDVNDANSTQQSNDLNLTYAEGNFTSDINGSTTIRYFINFDRNRSNPLNPFDLNITDINVSDIDSTTGSAQPEANATFYYGRINTSDISTNLVDVNHSLHVEIYSQSQVRDFHRESLNWYINEDDNETKNRFDLNDSFNFNDINNTNLTTNITSFDGGVLRFGLNNPSREEHAHIHVGIPSYLWYSQYSDYNASGDCSEHPCFEYRFTVERDGDSIQSGDFEGSDIGDDFNATRTKTGVKVFR